MSNRCPVPVTLHQEGRVCPLIKSLKNQLEQGHQDALAQFWLEVQRRGTPLMDTIDGDPARMLVTFIWKGTANHHNVVIASYGIASFDPLKNRMVRIDGTDVWHKSWVLPKNARTVYCFSPNDPLICLSDYRADQVDFASFTRSWTKDPFNPKSYYIPGCLCVGEEEKYMSLLEMPEAEPYPWMEERSHPQGIVVKAWIPSERLETGREAYIYLPPGYDENREESYPLVIAFDGYSFKDFMHGPQIFDTLIAAGAIPPMIAVMLLNPSPNSVTRFRDLACYEPFCDFVAQELVPWVRKAYRATSDPHQTILTGASLGGVASVYLGLTHPELFGNVIAQSGAYWWTVEGEENWLLHLCADTPKRDVKFFLDVGILETVPCFTDGLSILNANRYLRDILLAKGYSVAYTEYPGGHDYICWEKTFADHLQIVFKDYRKGKQVEMNSLKPLHNLLL